MSKSEKKSKKIKIIPGFIRHDFLRKLIALLFAILVWQRVDTQISEPDTLIGIPLHISLPGNVKLLSMMPEKVSLKIKASRRIIDSLSIKDDIDINIKLDDLPIPKNPLVISHRINLFQDIRVPSGVTVLQVKPEIISINVDKKISKSVPVELISSGFLLDAYSFRVVQLIPDSVIITGAQSVVKQIKKIKTEPVVLKESYVEDFECKVKTIPRDDIIVSSKEVTAVIEIYKKRDVREFSRIPIKPFGTPASSARVILKPDQAFMIISGIKKSVELMNESQLHPFVDITGLKVPGIYNLEVKCWIDDKDVSIKEIQPEKIEVELKKAIVSQ